MISFTHELSNYFVKSYIMYWAYLCLFNVSQDWFCSHLFFFKINNETKTGTEGNMKHFFKPMPDHYRKFLLKPVPDQHRNSLFSKISTGFSLSREFRSLIDHSLCYSAYLVNEHLLPGPLSLSLPKRVLPSNAILMRIDDAQPSSAGACAKMGVEDRKWVLFSYVVWGL